MNDIAGKEVLELIQLADHARAAEDNAQFLERLEPYIVQFEVWRQDVETKQKAGEPTVDSSHRDNIVRLQELHGGLVERALSAKEGVGKELSELRRKGQAMRAYGDVLPSRVTITGKRKG